MLAKKLFRGFLLFIAVMILWNLKLVLYGINQLQGQLHIVQNAKPIEEVLKNKKLKENYKRKLLLIQEIKKFAVDSLGLKNSDNYSTFYDQQSKPVLWVLTGCEPFSLKAYEWHFPFLGNVSYKGFFKKEKGEKELKNLLKEGFDTDLSTTSGWSTLGWFKDPVLSNFLKRPDGVLAETIIHELTHATIYLKSSVDYNENLATFVGENGTELFLQNKFGRESKELIEYAHYKADEEIYSNHLLNGAKRLDSLYQTFINNEVPFNEMLFRKYKLISYIMLESNKLPLHRKDIYRFNFGKEPLPNNTFFMAYLRYRKNQNDFSQELKVKFNNNLPGFISDLKAKN